MLSVRERSLLPLLVHNRTVPIFRTATPAPFVFFALLLAATLAVALGPRPAAAQTTFTVNIDIDADDGGVADGTCDVVPISPGNQCTLREAIIEANAAANAGGPDVIEFDIPSGATPTDPHVLTLARPLPLIEEPVEIDGRTEPDYGSLPVIEVDGTNAGADANGFEVAFDPDGSGALQLYAVSVINFDGDGLNLTAGLNRIVDSHIGVRADGLTSGPNGRGAFIGGGASASVVTGCIISANLDQALSITTDNVRVANSRIGVDKDGGALGNSIIPPGAAISVNGNGAEITGNLIRYNEGPGIRISDLTPPNNNNEISGNGIGNNTGIGIDLESSGEDADGRTPNDAGDADTGPNRLQNYPEIQSATVNPSGEVTLTYLVDSDPSLTGSGASAYPLTVDLYRADADMQEGLGIVGQDTYTATDYGGCGSAPCTKTVTVTSLVSVTQSDFITATATDADGNTSELSAPSQQLPVEFADINAQISGDTDVTLTWSTLSETGNDGFYIERRVDGAPFAEIGVREGAGTTTETQRYRFVDRGVPFGAERVAYRLRQVDVDGEVDRSEPVAVTFGAGERLTLTAPQPHPVTTQATVNVRVPENVEDATLVLYDLLGRPVRRFEASALKGRVPVQVSTGDLAAGTYILRLTGADQTVTQKITVVR